MPALAENIEIGYGNRRAALPVLEPTLGPAMIDTRRLREETGYWAFDPSFGATGACRSAITYVDATTASCSIAAIRSISSSDVATTSMCAGSCSTGICRQLRRKPSSPATSRITRC